MANGNESKNALVKLIGGKRVTIYVYGQDQFGRYVGDIYCDDVFIQVKHKLLVAHITYDCIASVLIFTMCFWSLQEKMLKNGHVWHFKTYDKRPEFAQVRN
jgi:endonuclease YncB( thermonuclease family)